MPGNRDGKTPLVGAGTVVAVTTQSRPGSGRLSTLGVPFQVLTAGKLCVWQIAGSGLRLLPQNQKVNLFLEGFPWWFQLERMDSVPFRASLFPGRLVLGPRTGAQNRGCLQVGTMCRQEHSTRAADLGQRRAAQYWPAQTCDKVSAAPARTAFVDPN